MFPPVKAIEILRIPRSVPMKPVTRNVAMLTCGW